MSDTNPWVELTLEKRLIFIQAFRPIFNRCGLRICKTVQQFSWLTFLKQAPTELKKFKSNSNSLVTWKGHKIHSLLSSVKAEKWISPLELNFYHF